jgi:predicted SnoaL-like aldol condensation-catalyzing enzyme
MAQSQEQQNKELVLKAFHTLFNERNYAAAESFWSPNYIQHSAHIEAGRNGLFHLIRNSPPTLRYEHGLILAEGDWVMVHGRFSDFGHAANWVAVDIVRVKDGMLAEHWDVLQDEVTEAQSKSKMPMFGSSFPTYE